MVFTWRNNCWVAVSPRRVAKPFYLVDCISSSIKMGR